MGKLATVPFNCPSCNTSYRLAYAKAERESDEHNIKCVVCGSPFPQRQGGSVLKYFAVDESGKRGRESL
jgi:transcription elongation factor Elf1